MDQIKEILESYQDKIKKFPELKDVIAKLVQEHERLKVVKEETRRLRGMVAHEFRSPLAIQKMYLGFIKNKKLGKGEKNKAMDIIYSATNQMLDLTAMLNLTSSSKRELHEDSEIINLEGLLRDYASQHNQLMKEEKIGLNFKYDYHKSSPIEIYMNRGVISAIEGTLFGNCLCYAPESSNINKGIRINKIDNLEMIMENATDKSKRLRTSHGMGKGRGFPFVKQIVNNLEGELVTYRTPQIEKNYGFCERYGYQNGKNPGKNSEIFGIKITIPMEELKKR